MNEYRDIEASLLRFCHDFSVECTQFGLEMDVVNLDAYANPRAWPEKDFLGPSEMRVDFSDGTIYVALAIVVSTRGDVNLSKMGQVINRLVNKVSQTSKILILDAVSGAPRGHLVYSEGMRVDSVIQTESQPARPVFINLVSDQILARSQG